MYPTKKAQTPQGDVYYNKPFNPSGEKESSVSVEYLSERAEYATNLLRSRVEIKTANHFKAYKDRALGKVDELKSRIRESIQSIKVNEIKKKSEVDEFCDDVDDAVTSYKRDGNNNALHGMQRLAEMFLLIEREAFEEIFSIQGTNEEPAKETTKSEEEIAKEWEDKFKVPFEKEKKQLDNLIELTDLILDTYKEFPLKIDEIEKIRTQIEEDEKNWPKAAMEEVGNLMSSLVLHWKIFNDFLSETEESYGDLSNDINYVREQYAIAKDKYGDEEELSELLSTLGQNIERIDQESNDLDYLRLHREHLTDRVEYIRVEYITKTRQEIFKILDSNQNEADKEEKIIFEKRVIKIKSRDESEKIMEKIQKAMDEDPTGHKVIIVELQDESIGFIQKIKGFILNILLKIRERFKRFA